MADSIASPSSSAPSADNPSAAFESTTDWASWARIIIFGSLAVGVIALASVLVISMQESGRKAAVRENWDAVYAAIKDKTKPDDRIAALEKVAEKVKGSSTHAWVLMELGDVHMQQAFRVEREPEDRAASLKKAIELYKLVATQEPYRSNEFFGPIAMENAALALEQGRDFDGAITVLNDALGIPKMETHYLYPKLMAQRGRVYWLRAQKASEEGKDGKADLESAKKDIEAALRATNTGKDGEQNQQMKWREQAEYIKSLLDPAGKALPDGKAPLEKPKAPEPKKDEAGDRKADEKKGDDKKPDEKKGEEKKSDDKKTEEKKSDDKKSETKTDEKKN